MFWADELGLAQVKRDLERYGRQYSNVSHWKPAALLTELVDQGEDSVLAWHRKQPKARANRSRL